MKKLYKFILILLFLNTHAHSQYFKAKNSAEVMKMYFKDGVFKEPNGYESFFGLMNSKYGKEVREKLLLNKEKNKKIIQYYRYRNLVRNEIIISKEEVEFKKNINKWFHPLHSLEKRSTQQAVLEKDKTYKLCSLIGTTINYSKPDIPDFKGGIIGCDQFYDDLGMGESENHIFEEYKFLESKNGWGKFELKNVRKEPYWGHRDGKIVWLRLDEISSPFYVEYDNRRIFLAFNAFTLYIYKEKLYVRNNETHDSMRICESRHLNDTTPQWSHEKPEFYKRIENDPKSLVLDIKSKLWDIKMALEVKETFLHFCRGDGC